MSRMVIGHKWSRSGLAIAFLSLVASLGCTSLIGDDFTIDLFGDAGGLPAKIDGGAKTDGPHEGGPVVVPGDGGVCQPGQKDCEGVTLRTCNGAGQWQVEATCPNLCQNGACVGMCQPGSKKCEANVESTCTPGGTWDNGTS